jgi:PPM family protein phosphatase
MNNMTDMFEMISTTDAGRVRSHNEDSIAADADIGLATLADGMGGYNAGEVASGIAVAMIPAEMRKIFSQNPSNALSDEAAQKLVAEQSAKVNAAIYNAAQTQPQYSGMGTTLVVALWHGNRMTVGHLGDSRLYLLRGEAFEQITRDHSWIQEQIDSGILTKEQARTAKNKNLVTRACGIDPQVETEVHTYPVVAGDIYLLCSDGLSDMIADDELHLTSYIVIAEVKFAAGSGTTGSAGQRQWRQRQHFRNTGARPRAKAGAQQLAGSNHILV